MPRPLLVIATHVHPLHSVVQRGRRFVESETAVDCVLSMRLLRRTVLHLAGKRLGPFSSMRRRARIPPTESTLPTRRLMPGAAPDRSAWKQISTTAAIGARRPGATRSAEDRRDPRCHARAMRLDEQANAQRAFRLRAPQ